jgi:hypothetical protein
MINGDRHHDTEPARREHGAFKVVGDTPLKLFAVHIVDKGTALHDYTK